MIKLEHVVLASPEQMEFIVEGMRNPMNSWDKSDSEYETAGYDIIGFDLGENDHSLMQRLSNAGTDHRKYMRMMPVYVRITAPLYWWSEFDTYKVGTVANSCSKMHKLLSKPFEMSDFSFDKLPGYKFEPKQYIPEADEDLEKWLEISDAQDGWLISNYGRVKHNGVILSCSVHSDGYIFSVFRSRKTGEYMQRPVHRLVADAFLPVVVGKDVINHIDGNKMNNSVMNLEWCTKSENEKHAWKNGLKRDVATKGELHGMHKLSRKDVEYIRENHIRNGGSMKTGRLAKMFSVNPQTITEIVSERIWRSILH